ncbi:hypothetical protein [Natronorubrum sulfidifaciens]|uniref:Uncharacterized protein n=1 Tax=Natronorubrum sulfidifaciens JCM 14089 TaxID=1230460 RepID=L9W9V1_9EURY|nr:hypothetical protein [Natronorubrum sulfidifaciens]ELY46270.1 hypothetical protein C495_06848 [Natronorubrum sulfidifaciens JCM 14089]
MGNTQSAETEATEEEAPENETTEEETPEETAETEPDSETADDSSRLATLLKGVAVFLVLFALLWWLLSDDEE